MHERKMASLKNNEDSDSDAEAEESELQGKYALQFLKIEKVSLSVSVSIFPSFSIVLTCRCPWRPEQGFGVTGHCEAPDVVLGTDLGSLRNRKCSQLLSHVPQLLKQVITSPVFILSRI